MPHPGRTSGHPPRRRPGSRLPCPPPGGRRRASGPGWRRAAPLRPSIKCAVQVGEQQQAHWGGKLVRMQGVAAQSQSLPQGGRQGPRSPPAPPRLSSISSSFHMPLTVHGPLYHPPDPLGVCGGLYAFKAVSGQDVLHAGGLSDAHLKDQATPQPQGAFPTSGSRPGKNPGHPPRRPGPYGAHSPARRHPGPGCLQWGYRVGCRR